MAGPLHSPRVMLLRRERAYGLHNYIAKSLPKYIWTGLVSGRERVTLRRDNVLSHMHIIMCFSHSYACRSLRICICNCIFVVQKYSTVPYSVALALCTSLKAPRLDIPLEAKLRRDAPSIHKCIHTYLYNEEKTIRCVFKLSRRLWRR